LVPFVDGFCIDPYFIRVASLADSEHNPTPAFS
jgi:hypothetical protein